MGSRVMEMTGLVETRVLLKTGFTVKAGSQRVPYGTVVNVEMKRKAFRKFYRKLKVTYVS